MKILVTGSKGLIGEELCNRLEEADHEVVYYDLKDGNNIMYLGMLGASLKGCDGIIHLAAMSRVIDGEKDPVGCFQTNYKGTKNVIEAADRHQCWLIYVSSREVYGNTLGEITTEDSPYDPESVYGESKMAAEELVTEAINNGMKAGIIRLSNVYGSPYDYTTRVIPAFMRAAIYGKPLYVEGSSNAYDFNHVSDVVDGIDRYVTHIANRSPGTIQLVSGLTTDLRTLASKVIKTVGSDSNIVEKEPRPYGSSIFRGSSEKAKVVLGWKPKLSLDEGLKIYHQALKEAYGV